MSVALEVRQLQVLVAARALVDIEALDVEEGKLAVIAGDAGSGKTLFAAALAGSVDARGRVAVKGKAVVGPPSQRRRGGLAVAIRDGSRIVGCTVDEALALSGGDARRRHEVFERFPPLATRRTVMAQFLSGGEQQMLQLACAWCAAASVLVVDSPTVGLAGDIAATVGAMARDEVARGCAVVWLEQDPRAAPAAASHRLLTGTVVAVGESASAPA
ncbi:MAG: ATP-binding cassette domain-containing protein [Candidatus Dormibacteria bacterium]